MALIRGFKAHAKRLATEVREELGLNPTEPLDHMALADHLGIPIQKMSAFLDSCPSLHYLTAKGQKHFSAITLFQGTWRTVIHNDSHAPCRQKSNIVHELAHALLQHPPAPPLTDKGERTYDSGIEGEANWLTGELLVPDSVAIHVIQSELADEVAASHYGVCPVMLRYRLRVTAAKRRVSRFRK